MYLIRQTNQHLVFTGISIQSLSKEIHVGMVITAWRRSQLQISCVKKKNAFEHAQNIQIHIILHMSKVLSWHFLSI